MRKLVEVGNLAWRRDSQLRGAVQSLDLVEPRRVVADEVLIELKAAGAGNWDEIARTGEWDMGPEPPMALGTDATGTILAVGAGVTEYKSDDDVLTHPLPLRDQGTWAELLIAPAELIALKPDEVSWEVAGAFAVPPLSCEQVLSETLELHEASRSRCMVQAA